MAFPAPTAQQARILWLSLTALALGVLLVLLGLLGWGVGWIIHRLSSVLLPLAVAGVLAYLLDPLVDFFERRLRIPRTRAILLVFFIAIMLVLILLATVVPKLIVETRQLIDRVPEYALNVRVEFSKTLAQSKWAARVKDVWDARLGAEVQQWMAKVLPAVSQWLLQRLGQVASWAGLVAGFALVPVYVFYFLLEKRGIQRRWTEYVPVAESQLKDEVVFTLTAINDCLIVFFRGQVLVAMALGALLTLGFLAIGLDYAVLLGVLAGVLSIIPYLGIMLSLVPALILAAIQFGWYGPLLVLVVVVLVQMAEGLFISPKIMGDRVGMHPLTIIISVLMGTTLLGGILGGVLAIPLTAALRTLMFRYVWKTRPGTALGTDLSGSAPADAAPGTGPDATPP